MEQQTAKLGKVNSSSHKHTRRHEIENDLPVLNEYIFGDIYLYIFNIYYLNPN